MERGRGREEGRDTEGGVYLSSGQAEWTPEPFDLQVSYSHSGLVIPDYGTEIRALRLQTVPRTGQHRATPEFQGMVGGAPLPLHELVGLSN